MARLVMRSAAPLMAKPLTLVTVPEMVAPGDWSLTGWRVLAEVVARTFGAADAGAAANAHEAIVPTMVAIAMS